MQISFTLTNDHRLSGTLSPNFRRVLGPIRAAKYNLRSFRLGDLLDDLAETLGADTDDLFIGPLKLILPENAIIEEHKPRITVPQMREHLKQETAKLNAET